MPDRPHRRRTLLAVAAVTGAAVAAAAVATAAASDRTDHARPTPAPTGGPVTGGPLPGGATDRPGAIRLVAYSDCAALRDGLRSHLAAQVGPWGLSGYGGGRIAYSAGAQDATVGAAPAAGGSAAAPEAAPGHSDTNVQEAGVDEPDIVKTDGRRIVTVSGGVLRVIDAAGRQLTGRLDLSLYAGADSAQLLVDGDRALVVLGDPAPSVRRGPIPVDGGYGGYYGYPSSTGTTVLLIDLASPTPRVIGTLRPRGDYVDARMHDGTVRLVVRSGPSLVFPQPVDNRPESARTADNRAVVRRAPLSAWLPSYDVGTAGGAVTTRTVPCRDVRHAASYTGSSLLTVYTVRLADGVADPRPETLVADGTTVYADADSLYVAGSDGTRTELHRFDLTGPGKPVYLGSGSVPGALLDSYSMSEYRGDLRVVTTRYAGSPVSSLYVLDARTLRQRGSVGGLGRGEQLHAVRFLGPLAYVVTFESVDPLFVLDLHDPARPRLAGELVMPGYSDYLHPVADGRLLGVGQSTANGRVTGLQLSLFDVRDPAHPVRSALLTRAHTPSETPIDPHAFLYWPASGLAVVPIDSWEPQQSGAALVVRVAGEHLRTVGTIRNPGSTAVDPYGGGIQRTLVIGDRIWTLSAAGLQASDLASLDGRGWVPFS